MTTPVRFAVVGCGWWAEEHHIPAIEANEDADLVAAADPDLGRLERIQQKHHVEVFHSVREMLQGVSVDAVVVATPNRAHADAAMAAIEADKNVLVEKPMTLAGRKARQLVKLAQERNIHIVVSYPFQMTSPARELRRAISSGILGDLELIVGTYTSSSSLLFLEPRARPGPSPSTYDARGAGGGQAQTQVTHILSSILWTSSLSAERVMASMRFGGGEPLDTVDAIVLDFQTGARGTIASLGTVPRDASRVQQVRYFGARGRADHDLVTARVSIELHDGTGVVHELGREEVPYPASSPVDTLVGLMTGTTSENHGPPEEAAHTVEILEASYVSAKNGRSIDVPLGFG